MDDMGVHQAVVERFRPQNLLKGKKDQGLRGCFAILDQTTIQPDHLCRSGGLKLIRTISCGSQRMGLDGQAS